MATGGARDGSLVIAGLGPGAEALVTPEVSAALAQATDVVGYIPTSPAWRNGRA